MLSFSWNCDVIVESADSQGATRPSYFGPESQKFNSSGLAACACPKEAAAMSMPSAAPKQNREPKLELNFFRGFWARMGIPRMIRSPNRAANPERGQVQHGNTVHKSSSA